MLGQSFGVFVDGPTVGSHQAFQRLFTTSVSWRSKPVPGHPVHEWVTGLPVVCSSHVQPFVQQQIPSHDGPNELRLNVWWTEAFSWIIWIHFPPFFPSHLWPNIELGLIHWAGGCARCRNALPRSRRWFGIQETRFLGRCCCHCQWAMD